MKGNSISKILTAAAVAGLIAGTATVSSASAEHHEGKKAEKNKCKGECKGHKKENKCKGEKKEGCDGKDGCSTEETKE